jgi:hypothetical protein
VYRRVQQPPEGQIVVTVLRAIGHVEPPLELIDENERWRVFKCIPNVVNSRQVTVSCPLLETEVLNPRLQRVDCTHGRD